MMGLDDQSVGEVGTYLEGTMSMGTVGREIGCRAIIAKAAGSTDSLCLC